MFTPGLFKTYIGPAHSGRLRPVSTDHAAGCVKLSSFHLLTCSQITSLVQDNPRIHDLNVYLKDTSTFTEDVSTVNVCWNTIRGFETSRVLRIREAGVNEKGVVAVHLGLTHVADFRYETGILRHLGLMSSSDERYLFKRYDREVELADLLHLMVRVLMKVDQTLLRNVTDDT